MQKSRRGPGTENLTDKEKYLLNGPVKEVMQITYKAHNRNGQIVEGKIDAGAVLYYGNSTYLFSPEGLKLMECDVTNASSYYRSIFNEKGQLIENYHYFNDTRHTRTVYQYNEAGQNTGHITYDEAGTIKSRVDSVFDEEGVRTEDYTYTGESEAWNSKTVYTNVGPTTWVKGTPYRKSTSIIHYLSDDSIEYQSTHTYNEDWNEIESSTRYTSSEMEKFNTRTVRRYNNHGDVIQQDFYLGNGSLANSYTYEYQYDENGNKIEPESHHKSDILNYNPLEEDETEQLESDHHDNWVKRTVVAKDRPRYITTRQFTYYGEPSGHNPPFEHPLIGSAVEDVVKTNLQMDELTQAQAQWVMEGTIKADAFPLHRYYAMQFKDLPSTSGYNYSHIEVIGLLKMLTEEMGVNMVHSTSSRVNYQPLNSYVLSFQHHPGYLLSVNNISRHVEENYSLPGNLHGYIDNDGYLYFGQVELLHPSKDAANYDEMFEEDLKYYIEMSEVEKQPQKPFIHIVEVAGNSYVLKSHPVNDHFEIRDLDVNYGSGFTKFHNDLMNRFNSSTKGLVLFHGEPGTGKTYYIRHLLRKMVSHRKKVIYMPPNMVDHLIDPAFMSFLSREIRNWSSQGEFCVLLIEDAEPLLARRREGVRIQGVTNLLNLSDGLLNDMLNLQIICTFNVDVKKLDSALLRPGRLIARKEFKKLDELDANLLAQRLGIRHHFTEPASLSEVYSKMENQNTLIHDVSAQDRDASSELDDL